jgi:4-amino-4-deoxy-L-arabinose transferase-like glycosyltransferase
MRERATVSVNLRTLVLIALAAATASRLSLAAHLELHFDEAYYWYWSKNLQASYYDHPAAVAWFIRAGTNLLGDTELGVRIAGQLCVLIVTYLLYDAARHAYSVSAALIAVAAMQVTLLVGAGSIIMTPDTPLLLFASVVLWALVRFTLKPSGWWWLIIGLAGGGALLSKYTAILPAVAVAIWIVTTPDMRRWLARPWPWLGLGISLFMLLPVLIWNAQQGWVSFLKQGGRLTRGGFVRPELIFEYIGGQMGVITPGLFVLLLAAIWLMAQRARRSTDPLERLLVLWFLVPSIFFLSVSPVLRVQANWLAPGWPAALLALAALHAHTSDQARLNRALLWCLGLGACIVVLVWLYALTLFGPCVKSDPLAQLTGQRALASKIGQIARQQSGREILAADYATASVLRFYLPGMAVFHLTDKPRYSGFPNVPIKRPALAVSRKPELPEIFQRTAPFKSPGIRLWRHHKTCPSRPYFLFLTD